MTLPTSPPPPLRPRPCCPCCNLPNSRHPDDSSPIRRTPGRSRHPASHRRHPPLSLPAATAATAAKVPPDGDPDCDDVPEGCSGGERRRRKRGRRGHRRDRHSSRRRRFRQRHRRRWRRGEPRRRKRRRDRSGSGSDDQGPAPASGGFTLIDLLLALAVLGIIALVTVPDLIRSTDRMRLRVAGSEASRIFTVARSYAILHSTHVGVKFHPGRGDEPTTWSLHRDGDGDGVRSADIRRGDDPAVPGPGGGEHRPARFGAVRLGFPPGPLPRDPGGRRLNRRHDPIRFNRSDIASFGPLGTATPGSLYLTDGRNLAAVRVTNRTGRVRVLLYDPERGEWR